MFLTVDGSVASGAVTGEISVCDLLQCYTASGPESPVRIWVASSTGSTKIFPSPRSPVRAPSLMALLLGILLLTLLPPSVFNVIIAVGIVYTPRIARVVRSGTLSVKREAFVKAAQSRGESDSYILFREILPNVMPPIIVEGSVRIGFAILIGASLSFLGLGAQPPYPDWGFMVSTAREHIYQTPWFLLWPSLALAVTILSINILGDGLRDVLDPKVTGDEV